MSTQSTTPIAPELAPLVPLAQAFLTMVVEELDELDGEHDDVDSAKLAERTRALVLKLATAALDLPGTARRRGFALGLHLAPCARG